MLLSDFCADRDYFAEIERFLKTKRYTIQEKRDKI